MNMTLIETKIHVSLENLADMIKNLSKGELETLELMVTGDGQEIKKRYEDFKSGKVKSVSEQDVFGDL
jgi:hypothetical protein